mmetsp:Transcript_33910/g.61222  ORF Transcript_33910/g.61222 Transcript_33910/m.61222 type:complete len:532 (-) Transcript_33910:558-2153(-)
MTDKEKIEDLKTTVEKLEALAIIEREEASEEVFKIKSVHDLKVEKIKLVHDSEMQALNSKYSALNRKHNLLLKRHQLIFDAFKEVTNVSDDASDLEQIDEATKRITQTVIKTLSSQTNQLDIAYRSIGNIDQTLEKTISSQRKEIKRLVTEVKDLNVKAELASTTIRKLEFEKCQLDKIWEEMKSSRDESLEELDRLKSKYASEKEKYEKEINDLQFENESLKEDYEDAIKEIKELENLSDLGDEMLRYLKPNGMGEGTKGPSPSFAPVRIEDGLIKKFVPHDKKTFYRFGLDINRYNILAVKENHNSFGLYSEDLEWGEDISTFRDQAFCVAWNYAGTLLALGGRSNSNADNCIQIWDIPKRKVVRRLKMTDFQICRCLDWNEDIIVAGTDSFIYQWDINDVDKDLNDEGNAITSPISTVTNMHIGFISSIQWSPNKSMFAAITNKGHLSIYDQDSNSLDHIKAHDDGQYEKTVQWCPWEPGVVATCCWRGFLKIWKFEKNIKLVEEAWFDSGIANLKWIPGKKSYCNFA